MASILYVGTDEGVVTLKSEDGRNWKQEYHGLKYGRADPLSHRPSDGAAAYL